MECASSPSPNEPFSNAEEQGLSKGTDVEGVRLDPSQAKSVGGVEDVKEMFKILMGKIDIQSTAVSDLTEMHVRYVVHYVIVRIR